MVKRIVLVICIGLGVNSFCFSQDSIPLAKDLTEEKNIQFQEYFFKALSEKAIRNYQKAIENLESCNKVLPNNSVVFFELSKNYLFLEKTLEAKLYIQKALEQNPNDTWMLLHLISIYKKEKNFKEAIKIQEKITNQSSIRKEELVYLYLQDRDYEKAIRLMNLMETETGLSKNLMNLKRSLEARKKDITVVDDIQNLEGLLAEFNENNSLSNLLKVLELAEKENKNLFFDYTEKGIELFPAQPKMYLFRAKALSNKKLYDEALVVLETGLDFVLENNDLIISFYNQLAITYKAIGNNTKYQEFLNKIKAVEK